jgi:glucosamine--fructose-6-phosphate aminotransferase (isomerizing)
MTLTERSIWEQFAYWRSAMEILRKTPRLSGRAPVVAVGCGTSYHLAQALVACLNHGGRPAQAVPGGEWASKWREYVPNRWATMLAFSRSGETTEVLAAVEVGRSRGWPVWAITCGANSPLTRQADHTIQLSTCPEEGIVMTASAALMYLAGLRVCGIELPDDLPERARCVLQESVPALTEATRCCGDVICLGGGYLYGIACEAALKLQEMSLLHAHAYPPLEYRHGPISLLTPKTLIVLLYHPASEEEDVRLALELQRKGATVLGIGGVGTWRIDVPRDYGLAGMYILPIVHLLAEKAAQARRIDTTSPPHLARVVRF